jgi:hypothetical protein
MSLPITETPALIEWLKKQPPEKGYNHSNPWECALGLYAHSVGFTYGILMGMKNKGEGFHHGGPGSMQEWEFHIARPYPHTFGAALARGEKFLAEEDEKPIVKTEAPVTMYQRRVYEIFGCYPI